MPFSLRTLQRYFLIGSNTILNIVTPLAIVDHVAACFNVNEGADEHRELTRLTIVGLYAALTLGMEYRSARRMTDEVMPEQRRQQDEQAEGENRRNSESAHNSAIEFASWSKTIGQGINTAIVVAKLGGGTTAGTLVGLGLGSGGYLHARHPVTQPSDIIHQSYYPGELTYDWRGLMSALLRIGAAASAIDNAGRYLNAYKIAAYEMVDIFEDPATQPFIDTEVLFLAVVCLLSATTMYSKFLLARNRSAAIWERHASAQDWREWLRRWDKRALLGAGAHSVLSYCNDRVLTKDHLPDWLSLAVSIALPVASFLGTYATNADYPGWGGRNGILTSGGGGNWQTLGEALGSSLSDEEAEVQQGARGDKSSDRSPSLMREAKGPKVIIADERQPKVVARPLPVADDRLVVASKERAGGKPGENYGCAARLFARFRRPQQTVEPSVRAPLLTPTEADTPIVKQPPAAHVSRGGEYGLP